MTCAALEVGLVFSYTTHLHRPHALTPTRQPVLVNTAREACKSHVGGFSSASGKMLSISFRMLNNAFQHANRRLNAVHVLVSAPEHKHCSSSDSSMFNVSSAGVQGTDLLITTGVVGTNSAKRFGRRRKQHKKQSYLCCCLLLSSHLKPPLGRFSPFPGCQWGHSEKGTSTWKAFRPLAP